MTQCSIVQYEYKVLQSLSANVAKRKNNPALKMHVIHALHKNLTEEGIPFLDVLGVLLNSLYHGLV